MLFRSGGACPKDVSRSVGVRVRREFVRPIARNTSLAGVPVALSVNFTPQKRKTRRTWGVVRQFLMYHQVPSRIYLFLQKNDEKQCTVSFVDTHYSRIRLLNTLPTTQVCFPLSVRRYPDLRNFSVCYIVDISKFICLQQNPQRQISCSSVDNRPKLSCTFQHRRGPSVEPFE